MVVTTELSGVGDDTADDLADHGFDSVEDIAAASIQDIAAVDGFGETRAEEIHEQARGLIIDDEDDGDDEATDSTTDDEYDGDYGEPEAGKRVDTDDKDETDDVAANDGTYSISLDIDDDVHRHLCAALVETELTKRQHHRTGEVADVADIVRQLHDDATALSLSESQVHLLYTAINDRVNEYRGDHSLDDLTTKMDTVRQAVNDFRQDNLF